MTNNNHHNNHNKLLNHHHHHHHHQHHLLPSSTTTSTITTTTSRSNSTTQACAACRYQRRKCAPDCILAPYFPHDRQRQFQNAHKLFGVSNITKIIRDLDPPQKDEAMRTIIYQSDVRAQDPVGGCYRIIRELQRQIDYSRAELDIVLHQLAICRTHSVHNDQNHHNHLLLQNQIHHDHDQILIDGVDCDIHLVTNDANLYDENANHDDGLDLDLGQINQQHVHVQDHDNDRNNDNDNDHEQYILEQQNLNDQDDGCENDQVQVQLQEINSWAAMNNSPPSSAICLEVKPAAAAVVVDECEDFKPLLINEIPAGERHEFKFEFDEINEPSEEALFNEENHKELSKEENVSFFTKEENVSYQQHNEDHDLKSAATLFTLTNCSSY